MTPYQQMAIVKGVSEADKLTFDTLEEFMAWQTTRQSH
jgi:hypothetical protein